VPFVPDTFSSLTKSQTISYAEGLAGKQVEIGLNVPEAIPKSAKVILGISAKKN
jgi:hypothetical protein